MKYSPLGKTGITASKICFGSLTVSPLQENMDPRAAGEVIAAAFSMGVNFVDTAELYRSYDHIREALRISGRDDIVISSKTYAYERRAALDAVDAARRALGRDVIDIFMLHEQESVHTLRGHRDALDALFELKARGVIRAVGASMHHIGAVHGAVSMGLDVIHPILNLRGLGIADGSRGEMETAIESAHGNGVGVFTMKPLGGGNLHAGAEECLSYAFGFPFADSVAIGMRSVAQVEANIAFLDGAPLSDISPLRPRRLHIDDWCDGCGKCVRRCAHGALALKIGMASVNPSKCVLCGYCSTACENFCIKMV